MSVFMCTQAHVYLGCTPMSTRGSDPPAETRLGAILVEVSRLVLLESRLLLASTVSFHPQMDTICLKTDLKPFERLNSVLRDRLPGTTLKPHEIMDLPFLALIAAFTSIYQRSFYTTKSPLYALSHTNQCMYAISPGYFKLLIRKSSFYFINWG